MSSLAHLLADRRVVVCVGSGGVGKTTTSAALAIHAAMTGRRVLCLTIDPARRLANSLGLDHMTASEQQISREWFERFGLRCDGSMWAMMLDPKRTFDELVRRYASSPEVRERILRNRLYQYISTSLAGTGEYMAMEKLYAVRDDPRWDLIVLDTPPTANALDFLEAPERLVEAIDSPAMRWFVKAFEGSGKLSRGLVGKGAALVLKGLARFTGGQFLSQVAEFVSDLNDLFGGFRERATQVASTLRSPDVAFVVVTSPAPLAIREAIFLSQRLQDLGIRREGFVVNAVHGEPAASTLRREDAAERLRSLVPDSDAYDLARRLELALADDRRRAEADRTEVERLRDRITEPASYVEVPALDEDVHDIGTLARLASYLTGSAAPSTS